MSFSQKRIDGGTFATDRAPGRLKGYVIRVDVLKVEDKGRQVSCGLRRAS